MKIEGEINNQPRLHEMMLTIEEPRPFDARLDIRSEDLTMLIRTFNKRSFLHSTNNLEKLASLRILSMAMERVHDFIPNPICFSDKKYLEDLLWENDLSYFEDYFYLEKASYIKIINTSFFTTHDFLFDRAVRLARSFTLEIDYYSIYMDRYKMVNVLGVNDKPSNKIPKNVFSRIHTNLQELHKPPFDDRYFSILATFRLAFPSDFKNYYKSTDISWAALRDRLDEYRQKESKSDFLDLATNAAIVTADEIIMNEDTFELIPVPPPLVAPIAPLPVIRSF